MVLPATPITLGAGELSSSTSVTIADDSDEEPAETVVLTIADVGDFTITIDPSDQTDFRVNAPATRVMEGDTVRFTVERLESDAAETFVVVVPTAHDKDVEVDMASDSLVFVADTGTAERTVTVVITDDRLEEDEEVVEIEIRRNGTRFGTFSLTIAASDEPTFTTSLSATSVNEGETITLTVATENGVEVVPERTFTVALADGASEADQADFRATDFGTITIAAGQSRSALVILVADGDGPEVPEMAVLAVRERGGATVDEVTFTIRNTALQTEEDEEEMMMPMLPPVRIPEQPRNPAPAPAPEPEPEPEPVPTNPQFGFERTVLNVALDGEAVVAITNTSPVAPTEALEVMLSQFGPVAVDVATARGQITITTAQLAELGMGRHQITITSTGDSFDPSRNALTLNVNAPSDPPVFGLAGDLPSELNPGDTFRVQVELTDGTITTDYTVNLIAAPEGVLTVSPSSFTFGAGGTTSRRATVRVASGITPEEGMVASLTLRAATPGRVARGSDSHTAAIAVPPVVLPLFSFDAPIFEAVVDEAAEIRITSSLEVTEPTTLRVVARPAGEPDAEPQALGTVTFNPGESSAIVNFDGDFAASSGDAAGWDLALELESGAGEVAAIDADGDAHATAVLMVTEPVAMEPPRADPAPPGREPVVDPPPDPIESGGGNVLAIVLPLVLVGVLAAIGGGAVILHLRGVNIPLLGRAMTAIGLGRNTAPQQPSPISSTDHTAKKSPQPKSPKGGQNGDSGAAKKPAPSADHTAKKSPQPQSPQGGQNGDSGAAKKPAPPVKHQSPGAKKSNGKRPPSGGQSKPKQG